MTFYGDKERLRRLGYVSQAACVQVAARFAVLEAAGGQLCDEEKAANQADLFAVAREHELTQEELADVIHMNVIALSAGDTDGL